MYDEMCLDTFWRSRRSCFGNLWQKAGKRQRNFFRTDFATVCKNLKEVRAYI